MTTSTAVSTKRLQPKQTVDEQAPVRKKQKYDDKDIADIPPEILVSIFENLSIVQLTKASRVCKSWRGIIDPSDANGWYCKRVVALKHGERALEHFGPLIVQERASWRKVAITVTKSFLDFIDTVTTKMNLQEKPELAKINLNFPEDFGLSQQDLVNDGFKPVPFICYGWWRFSVDQEARSIHIAHPSRKPCSFEIPIDALPEAAARFEEIKFTHLACEESYLFAMTTAGLVFQLNYKTNQIIQIIKTSLYENFQNEKKERDSSSALFIDSSEVNRGFFAKEGRLVITFYNSIVEVFDYFSLEKANFHFNYLHTLTGLYLSGDTITLAANDYDHRLVVASYNLSGIWDHAKQFALHLNQDAFTGPAAISGDFLYYQNLDYIVGYSLFANLCTAIVYNKYAGVGPYTSYAAEAKTFAIVNNLLLVHSDLFEDLNEEDDQEQEPDERSISFLNRFTLQPVHVLAPLGCLENGLMGQNVLESFLEVASRDSLISARKINKN